MKKLTAGVIVLLVSCFAVQKSEALQTAPPIASPQKLVGLWIGALKTPDVSLRTIFRITSTEHGESATLSCPDQGFSDLPGLVIFNDDDSLSVKFKQIGAEFHATLNAESTLLTGTWSQGGGALPLVLHRGSEGETLRHRPQTPLPPFPYKQEDVSYLNKIQGDTLAGTVTVPSGKGPFPAVVLITGSGPQDRDETILGHKPFMVLADYLSRRGILVLRSDDRGMGKSTGNFNAATTADFATDVEAAISYLKLREDVNPKRIGLIGHSEGGIIAPMVAAKNKDVAFIVLMAGTGVTGEQLLIEQVRATALANGISTEDANKQAEQVANMLRRMLDTTGEGNAGIPESLSKDPAALRNYRDISNLPSPWREFFLRYDPSAALRNVKCPVLAIGGSKDVQVPPYQNLPLIRSALGSGRNRNFEVLQIPGVNHLFQTSETGAPNEYGEIEETISPKVLDIIFDWIRKVALDGSEKKSAGN